MSPLPWKAEYTKVVSDDMWIADFSFNPEVPAHIALTNTTFMVRAVNSHAELVAALEPFAACTPISMGTMPESEVYLWKPSNNRKEMDGISIAHITAAKAALARANGGQP